jgi:hypothetical protein
MLVISLLGIKISINYIAQESYGWLLSVLNAVKFVMEKVVLQQDFRLPLLILISSNAPYLYITGPRHSSSG